MSVDKSKSVVGPAPKLSSRGKDAVEKAGQFITMAGTLFKDGYHPISNPEGYIILGVAENTLQHKELGSYFSSSFRLSDVDFTYGTDLSGSVRLNESLARFFNKYFAPKKEVSPDHIIAGAGCSAVIDQLVYHLGDNGDGILIAAPYYSGFNSDLASRAGIKPIPVPVDQSDPFGEATLDAFESTLKKITAEGTKVRGVILCNPHNPLGQCYPRETILAYARFCQRHNLHLISDEIYALSVFPTNDNSHPAPFISVLSIDFEEEVGCDPGRIHALYGMSKDFNANGLRIGVLVTQYNDNLLIAVRSTSVFMKVASPADVLWSGMLNDSTYLPKFIAKNQKLLREAYEHVTGWLKFHNILYIPSNAGHFLMADFRQFFPSHDPEGKLLPTEDNGAARDHHLFMTLIRHKVYIGTATAFNYPVPGWFRLTFSVRRDYLDAGLMRVEKALGLAGWDQLGLSGSHEMQEIEDAELKGSTNAVDNLSKELEEATL